MYQTEQQASNVVFVYGSLKRGYRNNTVFLDGAKYLGAGQTVASHYDMFSLGMFPAAVRNGNYALSGELYAVNEDTMKALDTLEGNGNLYKREIVPVVSLHDARFSAGKEPVKAWIYFWMYPTSDSLDSKNVFSYLGRNVMVKTWGLDENKRASVPLALQAENVTSTVATIPAPAAAVKEDDDGYGEDDDDEDDDDELDFYRVEPELDIKIVRMKMRN